jgi:carboxyl-terminal processing protease
MFDHSGSPISFQRRKTKPMRRHVFGRPFSWLALGGILAVSVAIGGAQAPNAKPTPLDQATSQIVAVLLERLHISAPKIDDDVSKEWFDNYFSLLDPLKYYFLAADIEEFKAHQTTLDDKIREGDLSFAKDVFDRFLTRSDERLADAVELLQSKPDFSIEESMVDDPKRLSWPADTAEARDRLRKLIKLELLQKQIAKEDLDKATEQLVIRYKDRNRYFSQFDMTDLLEVYLTAMTTAVDPHTSYLGPKTLEDMISQGLHLSLEGIGASLMMEDGYPVVKEIVPGGAADKDGRLQVEDRIIAIVKDDGSRDDFVEKKLSDVVRKIRGPKGSKVRIVVQSAGSKEEKVYELTREKVELVADHAKSQIIDVKTDQREQPVKLGVIRVPAFYGDTLAVLNGDPNAVSVTEDCRKFLEQFKKDGAEAVVIDMRGNGGGLLQESISLSGLFIDQGPVVQVREPGGRKHFNDDDKGTAWDGPLVLLIDKTSASASEIFAGVIKDYGRGLIIGDSSTYGKGTVQQILPLNEQVGRGKKLPNLGALKLTIQQFYRPNGESTQINGVPPDIHIPSARDHADFGEGRNDSALVFDKVAALAHDMYNRVPEGLITTLGGRSKARREADEKFRDDQKFIDRLIERKARHEISLNEEKFRNESRRDEFAEEQAAKPKKRGRHEVQNAWEADDYYNKEVAAIAADYVALGRQILIAAPTRVPNAGEDIPAQVP